MRITRLARLVREINPSLLHDRRTALKFARQLLDSHTEDLAAHYQLYLTTDTVEVLNAEIAVFNHRRRNESGVSFLGIPTLEWCRESATYQPSDSFVQVYIHNSRTRYHYISYYHIRQTEDYFTCPECDRTYHNDFLLELDGISYCRNCYPGEHCDSCGERYHSADLVDGDCQNCRDEREGSGSSRLRPYGHDWRVEDSRFLPVRTRGSKTRYLGVELELEILNPDKSVRDLAATILEDVPYVSAKEDGSLYSGLELVSVPATLEYQYEIWSRLFDHLPDYREDYEIQCYRSPRCGLHVHVSKAALPRSAIRKLDYFFNAASNREFVQVIAQRADFYNGGYSHKSIKVCGDSVTRYTAVNTEPPQTVEIRIYKGTLNRVSFYKSLEFTDALCRFVDGVSCVKFDSLNSVHFCHWLGRTGRKEYPNLKAFLRAKGYLQDREPRLQETEQVEDQQCA
jgi:hypothetical protein